MKKDHMAMVALVMIPLYLLTVVNAFWPVQAVSADENRTLQQMPQISLQGRKTASSRAPSDFSPDQFPFRSFFVQVITADRSDEKPLPRSPLSPTLAQIDWAKANA